MQKEIEDKIIYLLENSPHWIYTREGFVEFTDTDSESEVVWDDFILNTDQLKLHIRKYIKCGYRYRMHFIKCALNAKCTIEIEETNFPFALDNALSAAAHKKCVTSRINSMLPSDTTITEVLHNFDLWTFNDQQYSAVIDDISIKFTKSLCSGHYELAIYTNNNIENFTITRYNAKNIVNAITDCIEAVKRQEECNKRKTKEKQLSFVLDLLIKDEENSNESNDFTANGE